MEVSDKSEFRRIFVDHGEAYGNLGDEAMLLSALKRLTKHLGPCIFVLPREENRPIPNLEDFIVELTPSPYLTFKTAIKGASSFLSLIRRWFPGDKTGLKLCYSWVSFLDRIGILKFCYSDYKRFLFDLARCEAFYGVGAADFNDFNSLGAAYKCWLYKIATRKVKLCIVSAQGFGPLQSGVLISLMSRVFKHLDALSFRDAEFSASFCRDVVPLSCPTQIVGDEALSLPAANKERCVFHIQESGLEPGQPFIVVHWRSTDYTQETQKLFPKIANLYDAVVEKTGVPLLFVPMSYDVHSRIDEDCYFELRSRMKHSQNLHNLGFIQDTSLIKGIIGASVLTLGLSYHIHVFGLAQNIPAVITFSGQYYHFKSHGLIDFYGEPSAAHNIEQSSVMDVLLSVMYCLAERENASTSIAQCNAKLLQRNDWSIELLAKMLKEQGL